MKEEILKMLESELAHFNQRELMHNANKNYVMANENRIKVNLTEVFIVKIKALCNIN